MQEAFELVGNREAQEWQHFDSGDAASDGACTLCGHTDGTNDDSPCLRDYFRHDDTMDILCEACWDKAYPADPQLRLPLG